MYCHACLCSICSFNCMICIDTHSRTQRKLCFKAQPYCERHPCEPTVRGSPMVSGSSLSHPLSLPHSFPLCVPSSLCLFRRVGPPQLLLHGPWTKSSPTKFFPTPARSSEVSLWKRLFPKPPCDFCFHPWQPGFGLTRDGELTSTLDRGGSLHCLSWDTERTGP